MNEGGVRIAVCTALLILGAVGPVAMVDTTRAGVAGEASVGSLAGPDTVPAHETTEATGSNESADNGTDHLQFPIGIPVHDQSLEGPEKEVRIPPRDVRSATRETTDPFDDAVPALELYNESVWNLTANNRTVTDGSSVVVYNGTAEREVPVNATGIPDGSIEPQRGTSVRSQVSKAPDTDGIPIDQPSESRRPAFYGIIGEDTRERITDEDGLTAFPWAPVVELRIRTQDGREGFCSGAIITEENASEDSYHVLTAGHCVYSPYDESWIDIEGESASYVVPAANGDEEPFGRVGIEQIRTYDGWNEKASPAYDMALLTLESRIGAQTGSLGYVGRDDPDDEIYTSNATRVTGYHADKPNHTMWTAIGDGLGTTESRRPAEPESVSHTYNTDAYPGTSGGPVWIGEGDVLDRIRMTAVNAYGVITPDDEPNYNKGPRITNDRFDDLQRWMAVDDTDGPANDPFEPNDQLSTATPIERDANIEGLRVDEGEFDLFAVELTRGDVVTAETNFDHATGDLDMAIYRANGTVVDSSTSNTDGEQVRSGPVPKSGTYYVGVYGHENASAPYSLSTDIYTRSFAEGPTIYIGSSSIESWGSPHAIDAATGTLEWSDDELIASNSPTVVNGTLYVGAYNESGLFVYSADAKTGEREWTFTGSSGSAGSSSPTVVEGTVYVGGDNSTLYAIDAETGDQEWVFETSNGVYSAPQVVDGTVYVGDTGTDRESDSTVYAVDADTGTEEWRFTTPRDPVITSPLVLNDTLYVGTGGYRANDSTFYALDTETGDLRWAFSEPELPALSSPTAADGTVYIGTGGYNQEKGTLFAIDAETGKEEWRLTNRSFVSSPTVWKGTVYIGSGSFASESAAIWAVDATTGQREWVNRSPSLGVYSSPTVHDGTVYVSTTNQRLYALDATTGDEEWISNESLGYYSSPTVVADPESGRSVGTRVRNGTLGHHGEWADVASEYDIEGASPLAKYANENGVVEASGLLDAAADFRSGAIDARTLLDVAAAFRSGDPVT